MNLRDRPPMCMSVLAGIGALLSCSAALAESFIAKDGKPNAEIVIAEKPPRMQKLAAEELRAYIRKITGAELPILTMPGADAAVHVYVGKSPYTERLGIGAEGLPNDGYRMVSGEDWLALIGEDEDYVPVEPYARNHGDRKRAAAEWDKLTGARWAFPGSSTFKAYNKELDVWCLDKRGSLNAVYDFLRSLGVRWYAAGELGEILPELKSIPLPEVEKTVRPHFGHRQMMFYADRFFMASRAQALWQLRLGLNWRGAAGGHGIDYVIHHENTRKAHPEFYMMVNGKRDIVSRGGKPCLSSEGLVKANVEFAKAYFDIYGGGIVSAMPTDGYVNLCQCDLCRGKATPERGYRGQLSDYVWGYVNTVAKELYKTHPNKKVSCMAYGAYMLPPEKIDKLHPNVVVGICQHRANFHDPEARREVLELRRKWLDKLSGEKKLFTHEYYLHGRANGAYAGIPVYYPHQIAEDLRSLKDICWGESIEVFTQGRDRPDPHFATYQLNCYVTARFWWDAEQDVDAMVNEYYAKYFGPAREEMKAFIEYSEANWPKMTKEVEPIDEALRLIAAAREAAGKDNVYARRVAWVDGFLKPLKQLREKLALGRKNVPRARVYSRQGRSEIKLDGKLDEPFWEGMATYRLREIETGRKPLFPTWFRAAWKSDNLYFAIHCHEPDVKNLNIGATRDGDTNIWNGDCVEILLETQSHAYYQIAVNPAGILVDLDRAKGIDTTWSSQAEVAAFVGEDFWSIEIRIPVAGEMQAEVEPKKLVSGRRPNVTHPWYFNIGRQRKRETGMEHSMFSPPGKRSFHVPMKFGKLYME